jgi:hypothetical protein
MKLSELVNKDNVTSISITENENTYSIIEYKDYKIVDSYFTDLEIDLPLKTVEDINVNEETKNRFRNSKKDYKWYFSDNKFNMCLILLKDK